MTEARRLRLRLAIPAHEYLAYYRNEAEAVITRALNGQVIEFPARALRRHVSRDGVYGVFEIAFDANHRLIRLDRVAD